MGDRLRGGWARGQMVREGEQSCASHDLRHAMRANHIVHRGIVFFASKQGFAAGSGSRRSDIDFSITHFTIPILPTERILIARTRCRRRSLRRAPVPPAILHEHPHCFPSRRTHADHFGLSSAFGRFETCLPTVKRSAIRLRTEGVAERQNGAFGAYTPHAPFDM